MHKNHLLMISFCSCMFISAFLLFTIQPMIGQKMLPSLGGSAGIWNISLLFFQSTLLAGYLYALLLVKYLKSKMQIKIHIFFIILCFYSIYYLYSGLQVNPSIVLSPEKESLYFLIKNLAFPITILCATAPLLQKWYSYSTLKEAHDPYFLYISSNLGSLLAVLIYPFVLTRFLFLEKQFTSWSFLWIFFVIISVMIGYLLLQSKTKVLEKKEKEQTLTWNMRLKWVYLAFIPSSLLLSLTFFITNEWSATPFFMMIPLSIFLLSFILAFTQKSLLHETTLKKALTLSLCFVFVPYFLNILAFNKVIVISHFLCFFILSYLIHRKIYLTRPHVNHLCEFYVWIALGGMLGGLFNNFIVPKIFITTPLEYPLMMILAYFTLMINQKDRKNIKNIFISLASLGLLFLCFKIGGTNYWTLTSLFFVLLAIQSSQKKNLLTTILLGVLLINTFFIKKDSTLIAKRNFFGSLKVKEVISQGVTIHTLYNGTTLHGGQNRNERLNQTYYFFGLLPLKKYFYDNFKPIKMGAIGLGVGSIACFLSHKEDSVTFYEINQNVLDIANNSKYFSFLRDCPAQKSFQIIDGRLGLKQSSHKYHIIVVDAFSSHMIPSHLMTEEAISLYFDRLEKNGILLFHISNPHFDLSLVFAALAEKLKLRAYYAYFNRNNLNYDLSEWILLRKKTATKKLKLTTNWRKLIHVSPHYAWSDSYINLFSTLR